MAEGKNIQLTIGHCDNAFVNADRALIFRLVSNLIDNAIKFTPHTAT